jgi:hypothetical protein
MVKQVWAALVGSLVLAVLPGCGGSAVNSGNRSDPAVAGSPGGSDPGASGSAPVGGAGPLPTTGSSSEPACAGTLDEASNAFGIPCPVGVCAATAWGETCNSLPVSVLNATESFCVATTKLKTITVNISATRGKACHYEIPPVWLGSGDGPRLVGAEAWDDTNTFCSGASKRITGGTVGTDCTPSDSKILCEGGAAKGDTHPNGCFAPFDSRCAPCCPVEPPDCADRPDGYPGFACVRADDGFIGCSCQGGSWACGFLG